MNDTQTKTTEVWQVAPDGFGGLEIGSGTTTVAIVLRTSQDGLSIASLIAAAPDLLAACEAQETVDAHYDACKECQDEEWCDVQFDLDKAARSLRRAALAKAKKAN